MIVFADDTIVNHKVEEKSLFEYYLLLSNYPGDSYLLWERGLGFYMDLYYSFYVLCR